MLVNNLKDLLGIINVAITYFNWDELRVAANGDPTAIIILTFGLTKSYNMLSGGYMMKKLNISRIPQVLFRKEFLNITQNPFLKITNDKINFIFESPQGES